MVVLAGTSLLISAAAIITLAATESSINKEVHKISHTSNACVDCSMLTLGITDDLSTDPLLAKLTPKVENRKRTCCAETEEQTSALFELVMRRQVPPKVPLPSYNVSGFKFSPASAHKIIYPEELSHDFGDIHVPQVSRACHFKLRNRDGLEHHRGVDILRNGIRVQHRGLYYIYSSILFRPQSTLPCKKFNYQTFTHSIYVISRYVSRQILETTYTCCDTCINNQESRYTGGMFILESGDLIQVKVMEYRLVHFEAEASFAGLVMMGAAVEEEADNKKKGDEDTSHLPIKPPFIHDSAGTSNNN